MVDEQGSCATCGTTHDAVVMLDPDVVPATTEQHVVRGGDSSMRWLGVLGVVVVGIVAWSILSSGESESSPVDEAVISQINSPTSTTDLHDSSTSSSAQPDHDDQDQVSSSRPDVGMFLPGGPLGDTGLTLVAGNPLTLLDLDTGEMRVTDVEHAQPIALIGDRLVYTPERAGTLRSLDINNLDAPAIDFETAQSSLFSFALGAEPGTIVALGDDRTPGTTMSRFTFDGSTGELLDISPVVVGFGVFDGFVDLGDFATPLAGGVYRIDNEEFEKVGEGRVVAQGGGMVLVQTCDDQLACDLQWHDGPSYEALDLPVPTVIEDGYVPDGGRVLVYRAGNIFEMRLLDLQTGEIIASGLLNNTVSHEVSRESGSEFVAFFGQGAVRLRDLTMGVETEVLFVAGNEQGEFGPLLIHTP